MLIDLPESNMLRRHLLLLILLGGISCNYSGSKADNLADKTDILVDTIPVNPILQYPMSYEDSLISMMVTRHFTDMKKLKQKMMDGEPIRIVCYGNSITYGFQVSPVGQVDKPYPQQLEKMLREKYQNNEITVVNEGHNGWRTDQALQNLEKLVIAKNPNLAIVKFGINDAYSSYPLGHYKQLLGDLVENLKKNKIYVLLLSPTPIDSYQNALVAQYGIVIKQVADDKGVAFLDMHTELSERIKTSQIAIEEILPDQVHLGAPYYKWIAEEIMEYWEGL